MRQESKLSFVKKVSCLSNYKNICKTVAKKHNFWMCYQLLKDSNLLIPTVSYSPKFTSQPLLSEDDCIKDAFVSLIPHIFLDSEIKHFSWLQSQSSIIHRGSFLLTKYDVVMPLFGKVIDILCYLSTIVLYVQEYVGVSFNCHYNAYLIQSHGHFKALNFDTIIDYRPISVHSSFDTSCADLYALMPYYY